MTTDKVERTWTGYICVLLVLLSRLVLCVRGIAMWIDGREIEQFVGEPFDIYVITDGGVVPYLKDAIYDTTLPILPPEVRLVELTWMAPDGVYLYKFTDLRSLDPNILYDPLLSIPKFGIVPKEKTVFQMTIPCTGHDTAVASMYIVLHVHNSRGDPIRGSPIKIHLRKRCIAFAESRRMCHGGCRNGGTCNEAGRCDCPKGYLGEQCQLAVCFHMCVNNGTCVKPGQCACPEGYVGHSCETAICREPCQHGGHCSKPGLCECPDGFYGDHCQHIEGQCHPPCINGGTCASNNTCLCLDGYTGLLCQQAHCTQSCGVNGFCADVNECKCYRGWRGRHCHKTEKTTGNRKKNTRKGKKKLRHGRSSRRLRRRRGGLSPGRDAPKEKKTKKKRTFV